MNRALLQLLAMQAIHNQIYGQDHVIRRAMNFPDSKTERLALARRHGKPYPHGYFVKLRRKRKMIKKSKQINRKQ